MCTGLIEILLPFPFEVVIDRTLKGGLMTWIRQPLFLTLGIGVHAIVLSSWKNYPF